MDERSNMLLRKARAWYGRPDFTSGIRPLIGKAFDYVYGWSEREVEGPGASTLGSGAGREGFEPSRELYTPYPLSRRVLSATQPPPRQDGAVARFYPAQALSILSSRWKLPADQARPRCGGRDARWRSERHQVPGARSGTRSPTA